MKKYLVLENNFQPNLTNKIFEGEQFNEYVKIDNKYFFLKEYVKEIKEQKITTNKTKIINSINVYDKEDKKDENIKEVLRLKRLLKKRSVEEIESIEYVYNNLIELYYLSSIKEINWKIEYILKDTILLILESSINLENSYYLDKIKEWIDLGINLKYI